MSDQPRTPESGDDSGMVYPRESPNGIPRWVKVAGIIVALVALVVVVVLLAGGDDGGHGPSRHGSGGSGTEATPTSAPEVHQPPEGGHD
jgi:hypothetical protein